MKKVSLFLSLMVVLSLLLAACSGADPTPTPQPEPDTVEVPTQEPTATAVVEEVMPKPEIGEANVSSVTVTMHDGKYVAVTSGFLPDGCTEIHESSQAVTDNAIAITLTTARPADMMCTQAIVDFNEAIPVDTADLPNGEYTVIVNGIAGAEPIVLGDEHMPSAEVTGTVTYRQRIALADDAILSVQIQDISLADAPAQVMGETSMPTEGAQVPLPFAVTYSPSDIQENHQYGLSVRITDGSGKLLFINDTVVPVITNGNPTSDIEVVVVPVGDSASAEKPASTLPPEIGNKVWQWTSFSDPASGEMTIDNPANYQLQFNEDGTFLIVADCNSGSGTYTMDNGSLSLSMGIMTRAFCGEESLDTQYLQYLEVAAIYFMQDGDLYFDLMYDSGTMRFAESAVADDTETPADKNAPISEDSVQMSVVGVAESYEWTVQEGVPASPEPGGFGLPPHILLTFDEQSAEDALENNGPRMYIFPTETYVTVAGDPAGNEISRLEELIAAAGSTPESPMPLLPPPSSFMDRWAQFSDLDFVNGQGVRYVSDSPSRQAIGVWANDTTAYYYQGLTADGRFYISLIWPVGTDSLPNTADEASADIKAQAENGTAEQYEAYIQATKDTLNALPSNAWTLDLTALDAMISSLNIQN